MQTQATTPEPHLVAAGAADLRAGRADQPTDRRQRRAGTAPGLQVPAPRRGGTPWLR